MQQRFKVAEMAGIEQLKAAVLGRYCSVFINGVTEMFEKSRKVLEVSAVSETGSRGTYEMRFESFERSEGPSIIFPGDSIVVYGG